MNKDLILEGEIELLAPLSHIGESIGPDSYLATTNIIGPDGMPVEVFVYSGNAFRGMLRDLGARYMLERLDINRIPIELFYLLFSGGNLGGEQSIDIDQARRFRQVLPLVSIFGGGVGNQLLGGKMNMGAMYPICRECERVLPERLRGAQASWRHWVTEQSYTRTDDAKNEVLRERFLALPEAVQPQLLEEGAPAPKKPKADKEQHQQMRYTQELLTPGARLYQRIDLRGVTEIEAGAFVSCLHEFARHPYIGGQGRIGHGLCRVTYTWREHGTGAQHFLSAGPDGVELGEAAGEQLTAYNRFLADLYDQYLAANQATLVQMLEAAR